MPAQRPARGAEKTSEARSFSQTRLLERSSAQVQVERLPSELRPKTRLRDITAIC
jgi:hypothetical protein